MKIYTSYYQNFKNIPKKFLCIGISQYIPDEFKTTSIPNFLYTPKNVLAPSKKLLSDIKSGDITNEEYAARYYVEIKENIKRLGFSDFNEYFAKMISTFEKYNEEEFESIVFLCYEKPNEFCHRHLLSALMNRIGYQVKEYTVVYKTPSKHTDELF